MKCTGRSALIATIIIIVAHEKKNNIMHMKSFSGRSGGESEKKALEKVEIFLLLWLFRGGKVLVSTYQYVGCGNKTVTTITILVAATQWQEY